MNLRDIDLNSIPTLESLESELDRRECRRLRTYGERAWPWIEPGKEYFDNWHIAAMCEHLEAVTAGEIRNLLVNVPPRHTKSLVVGVIWPTWEWGPMGRAHEQYLTASYSATLSIRDAVKSRRLINSPWYQARWGHVFKFTSDQNAKVRYDNDKNGYRIATSVDGSGTGEGGSRIIVDDPHNAKEAQSDVIRAGGIEWWSQTMSTRLNNPKTDARVVVMQRLHEDDLSGYIMKSENYAEDWVHLILPAEYEARRKCRIFLGGLLFFEDPRTKEGELINPVRFDEREIKRLKAELGVYGAAGQLQQRPDPSGGGVINTGKIKLWPKEAKTPELVYVLQSYDTATSETTLNDPTAHLALGVFERRGVYNVLILDAWQEHLKYPALRKRVKDGWLERYGDEADETPASPMKSVNGVLIEDKSSGPAVRQDLRSINVPVVAYNPGKVDKVQRAHDVAPLVDVGIVWVYESTTDPGKPVEWVREAIEDLRKFPVGHGDHYVDAFTQALRYLRDAGYIKPDLIDEPDPEVDYHERKPRRNVYAT